MKIFILLTTYFLAMNLLAKPAINHYPDIQKNYKTLSQDSLSLLKLFYFTRDREKIQYEVLKRGAKSAPALVTVMKDARFNERNRWTATFLLGRVVGKKSSKFLKKFTKHPNWILRLASLKTLTALSYKEKDLYQELLRDSSMIVRMQTLDSIEKLKIKSLGKDVFKSLFDKSNYQKVGLKMKRSNLIKKAVLVLGNLKYEKALKAFSKMLKQKDYRDIHPELKLALAQKD